MARTKSKLQPGLQGEFFLPQTIGFRLDEESNRILTERAARLRMNTHELARSYVVEILYQGEERAALRELVSNLKVQLDELAQGHALAVEALLASAGKIDEAEAQKWVKENLQ